jgi:hypothetical protein
VVTRQSAGVVVAMPIGTTQPIGAKGPYFIDANAGRRDRRVPDEG